MSHDYPFGNIFRLVCLEDEKTQEEILNNEVAKNFDEFGVGPSLGVDKTNVNLVQVSKLNR